MIGLTRKTMAAAATAVLLISTAGCVDERIVYRDRDLVDGIPTGHSGFVGLSNQETNLTVCGNCHISYQGEWEQTAHAQAWETLEASGHAQALCENCHTVGQLGNVTNQPGGYETTGDERYHGVQCESCHGPGLAHVQNPNDATRPLAPIAVGVDLDIGCGECHQGSHHPFVEEWSQSKHGAVVAYPAGRADCQGCHTGEGTLEEWGINSDFLEKDDLAPLDQHVAITCAVCHDPHSADNEGQLRFPVDVANEENNLCMKCHHKRGTPDMASQGMGPHSPQGPLLLGYAGWWPPNMQFVGATGDTARVAATHGSAANPNLCAGCHVNRFQVTDQITGDFVLQSVGHLFEAVPCLDAQGVPYRGNCADTERTYQTCVGCHGSEDVARSIRQVAANRIQNLVDELNVLIAQAPATEVNATDGRYSTLEGAKFNVGLATGRFVRGASVHNPFLLEALLSATIKQMEADYGVSPSPTVSLSRQLGVD
ncbi:MAG TPA: multiheme c-type cytochrome [Longimicrobiales bacterium]